jgi:hypothetical protein
MQPVNISDTGYQMFLDDESVFAPRERGLERQAKQNALARQQSVRNALAQSINPKTGLTNYEFAQQIGGVDIAPELQAAQQADMMAQTELRGKRATALKAEADAASTENDRMAKAMQTLAALTGASVDESSYQTNLQTARDMGFDVSNAPANYDENYVSNQNRAAIDAAKRFELQATRERDQATAANQRGTLTVAQRNAAVNEAAEARLGAEATRDVVRPKLKPGERWNAQTQTVEAVPGSSEYIKQQGAHKKDYSTVASVQEQRKLADEKIDFLLAPENKKAFENLFGGYTEKYITSKFSGPTAAAKTELNSLKSNLKNAGLRLIQQGGKIGAITEREWPILEGMIAELDSTLEPEAATRKLGQIKAYLARMEANAADEYETTWGNTQYYKPHKANESAAPAVGTVEDGHRFKGGNPSDSKNWEPI